MLAFGRDAHPPLDGEAVLLVRILGLAYPSLLQEVCSDAKRDRYRDEGQARRCPACCAAGCG